MLANIMNYLHNLIDEYNYLILQWFSDLRELLNSNYAEYHLNSFTRPHNIHELICMSESLSNNLGPQLSKSPLEQISYLVYCLFQNYCLHLRSIISLWDNSIVRFEFLWLFKRILSQLLDNHNDFLYRLDYYTLCVIWENQWCCCKNKTSENCCGKLKNRLISILFFHFEPSKSNKVLTAHHSTV